MKVLSIRQPWANLVAEGLKIIETRNWKTNYRGPLAIHAGKVADKKSFARLKDWGVEGYFGYELSLEPRGAIIAISELVEIIEYKDHVAFIADMLDHLVNYGNAKYGWCLPTENTRNLKTPLPRRGMPGLFEVPDKLISPGLSR